MHAAFTITCPSCRKSMDPFALEPVVTCPRCGCDLGELTAITKAAHAELARAHHALAASQPAQALQLAEASWRLRHTKPAARLATAAASSANQPHEVLQWRRRAE